jgi:hypothetical protein
MALPKSQGGLFDFMHTEGGRLVPTGAGKIYFIVTGFAITIPLVWVLLATINRRSRDFNLHEQRQLQIRLRGERLQKTAEAQPAE